MKNIRDRNICFGRKQKGGYSASDAKKRTFGLT